MGVENGGADGPDQKNKPKEAGAASTPEGLEQVCQTIEKEAAQKGFKMKLAEGRAAREQSGAVVYGVTDNDDNLLGTVSILAGIHGDIKFYITYINNKTKASDTQHIYEENMSSIPSWARRTFEEWKFQGR